MIEREREDKWYEKKRRSERERKDEHTTDQN